MNKDKQITKKSFVDQVWNSLSSVTFAIIIFTLISITSIVGTVLEQQAEPQKNLMLLKRLFGDSAAPIIFKVLDTLGFTDMYHSWWFITLLFLFAANIVICSLDRLPRIIKSIKEKPSFLKDEHLNLLPISREIFLAETYDRCLSNVQEALKKAGFKVFLFSHEDRDQIFAEKGRYSRLGVYITHLSILLILFGAVVGIYFGFNAYLNLLEGTQSSVAYKMNEEEIPLGFEIRCDDFDVVFYENSDTPKAFTSLITIIEDGKEVIKKTLSVNEPLKYKGITFYQSSYGFAPSMESLFKLKVASKNGKVEELALKFGESFMIPESNIKGVISDFSPALAIDKRGRLFTYAESMNNPAVFIEFFDNNKPLYSQWILRRYPETWKVPYGTIEFQDLWKSQYTGLQVRKDPGVWIVYLGCLFMSIGLYIAFFKNHLRIYVNLRPENKGTKIILKATTNKFRNAFEQKIDKILNSLK
ncbi:MAG: cytochrome c biogenesis protein ResB [Thermodesulfovibrionales bacterium]|nr:cytochrome c biogenesis protein ResB [Thermodesulfovibrionales bacterium]